MFDELAQGHHRHRPHPLGHPRAPLGRERPPAHATRAWRWCTTASSRTTSRSRPSCKAKGHVFSSETDTEVFAHLISDELKRGAGPAGRGARRHRAGEGHLRARGGVRDGSRTASSPPRTASPMVLGLGAGAELRRLATCRRCSSTPATSSTWRRATWPCSPPSEVEIFNRQGELVNRAHPPHRLDADDGGEGRPQALHAQGDLGAAARGRGHPARPRAPLRGRRPLRGLEPHRRRRCAALTKITILACGTSWHSGLAGKLMIESLARIPVEVELASEFRYRDPIVDADAPGHRHQPVRRDRGHAGGAQGGQGARRDARMAHLQRDGQRDDPRGGLHRAHQRRPGDWRRVHQGLHHAAGAASTCWR